MARSYGNMEIDARKLTRALAKNGYSIANAGVAMGRSKSYFDHILKEGYATKSTLIMLEAVMGIKYEDIAPDAPETGGDVAIATSEARLKELIKEAIREVLAE